MISSLMVEPLVRAALLEDLGRAGDITTEAVVPAQARAETELVARQPGVIAGLDLAALAFRLVEPAVKIEIERPDGTRVQPGDRIAAIEGPARGVLTAERVALNFLGHLSGVATATATLVDAVKGHKARICCTSGNAQKIVESLGVPKVIMLPDEYLAQNVAHETAVEIVTWAGHCEVHERFSANDIRQLRAGHPGIVVLAHPECPPEVVAEADFAGSTAAMIDYVGKAKPARVVLMTECSMSDNVAVQHPGTEFIRPCNLCPHMKRITLPKIRRTLETMTHEVTVDPAIAERARRTVERMLELG